MIPVFVDHSSDCGVFWCLFKVKQDGRLAPAFISPNYKYFDQLLQTVKNKTTSLNLVFKEFLQTSTSIPPLISVLYAKGYHDFPLKNFCLTVPKKLVEEPFCVSENFGYRKISCLRGESHDFLSKIFCLPVPKNFVGERNPSVLFFRKFPVAKKLLDKRGRVSRDFPPKIFCLTVPKNFLGEPFCVAQNFCYRKILWITGGGGEEERGSITIFCQNFFSLTVPKNFVGESFNVSLISVIEKFYA